MKNSTPRTRRSFVVEYKSSRRQPKPVVKSIWGDTDLKTLTQAVADDMPFSAPRQNITDSIEKNAVTNQNAAMTETPLVDLAESYEAQAKVAFESEPALAPVNRADEVRVAIPAAKPKTQRRSRSAGVRRVIHRPKSAPYTATEIRYADPATDSCDVLSALELENKTLKHLLVEKLQSENRLLREMLERFEQ